MTLKLWELVGSDLGFKDYFRQTALMNCGFLYGRMQIANATLVGRVHLTCVGSPAHPHPGRHRCPD